MSFKDKYPEKYITAAYFKATSIESPNAWVGHLPFAAWIIQQVKPKIFVELGTHTGNSYFSFCQTVEMHDLPTSCYAVDTWAGDVHAGHYSDEVFYRVDHHNREKYSHFSKLMRMTFDDALSYFADASIELLHIDGLHTYEAVKHDFESWLPKLAPGAVVLFHDTQVRERNFGVWKLWQELKEQYPLNIEFLHSHGLGVLQLNNAEDHQKVDCLKWSSKAQQSLVRYFAALGDQHMLNFDHKEIGCALAQRDGQLATLNQAVADRDGQLVKLNQAVAERDGQIASLNQVIQERDGCIFQMEQSAHQISKDLHDLRLAVQSAKRWQKRSWAKSAFHRWRAPLDTWQKVHFFKKLERSIRKRRDQFIHRITKISGDLQTQPDWTSRWLQNTVAIARNTVQPLSPLTRVFNPESLNIHWIIPDFSCGGGGHMSIFRIVRYLESFGHRQTIWIQNPTNSKSEKQAWENIRAWYQPIDRVIVRFLPDEVEGISGDLVIATDMWTTFPAGQMTMMKERFYLVQDYEKVFYTHGTFSYIAEMTYRMGYKAICAGSWLKSICESKYGLWTRSWNLAYDPLYYYQKVASRSAKKAKIRIAFYARATTPRRAVEIGREALLILHDRGVSFHVDLFGQINLEVTPPYSHTNHGVLEPEKLGDLYRSVDVGLVFSATNYSLIPIEMMACGLPVVELDVESTRAVFPEDVLAFAPPTPHEIANTLQRLVESFDERENLRERGLSFSSQFSWEGSARTIESALLEGLSLNNMAVTPAQIFTAGEYTHKAAVIIPTWNGGELLRDVLSAVVEQKTDWLYEVMVIDSGSSDDTIAIVNEFAEHGVRLHQIPNSEFQHGRTRNVAISMTSAEFVAILTQDSMPANSNWLANLIKAFDQGEHVAGVFGCHCAYPDASAFVRNNLDEHFRYYDQKPHLAHWNITPEAMEWGSVNHQQWLHYYSDNNSAMRRCVWEKIPYPEINWGEDQVWAWEIIKQGYQKAYANDAVVFHSHNLSETEQSKVSMIEGDFWLRYFGYRFETSPNAVHSSVSFLNGRDTKYAKSQGIAENVLLEQHALNRAAVSARYLGQHKLIQDWRRKAIGLPVVSLEKVRQSISK